MKKKWGFYNRGFWGSSAEIFGNGFVKGLSDNKDARHSHYCVPLCRLINFVWRIVIGNNENMGRYRW